MKQETNSVFQRSSAECECDDRSSLKPAEQVSGPSRFSQLPPQKQFAFVTLAAVGTAMFITGRSVRAIMKRIPKNDPVSCPQEISNTIHRSPPGPPIMSMSASSTPPLHSFWDNKSLLCRPQHRPSPSAQEINFNPAADAAAALGLATCLVIGATTLAIKTLGNRWELDGWEDWRMFIESGHLRTALIPSDWTQTASKLIPNRLRPQADPSDDSEQQWDWRRSIDEEWAREQSRRQMERVEWERQRQAAGRKIW